MLRDIICGTDRYVNAGEVFLTPDELGAAHRPFNYWSMMREAGLLKHWRGKPEEELANLAAYCSALRVKAGDRLPCVDIKPAYLASLDRAILRRVPLIVEGLAEQGFHFIHLRRRNLLEQVASLARARTTGEWAKSGGREAGCDTVKVTLDPATIVGRMNSLRVTSEAIEKMLRPYRPTELIYEEMTADGMPTEDLRRRLARECGVEVAADYAPRLRKLSPPLDALVANLDVIRRELEGTPDESFLPRR